MHNTPTNLAPKGFDEVAAARVFNALTASESAFDARGSMTPATDAPFPSVPGYTIMQRIGRGGGGEVFAGVRVGADRTLAIKLLRRLSNAEDGNRRAWRELDVLSQLHMPGIPHLHDYGMCEGRMFIVTDHIHGRSLDVYCREVSLGREDCGRLLARIADIVHSLHEHGIIHRDIKPSNILIDQHGDPVVIDLGIATLIADDVTETLTADGEPIGSPAFMAPEQARGDRAAISTRSDVFSLGATGFQILTNSTPFDLSVALHEAVRRVAQGLPRDIHAIDPAIPRPLAAVLNKSVSAEPERRYESAAAFAADLRRALNGEPVVAQTPNFALRLLDRARRRPLLALVTVGTAVAALSLIMAWAITQQKDQRTYVDLDAIAPPVGFKVHADYPHNQLGCAVAIGDITGDGVAELIVGEEGSPNKSVKDWIQTAGVVRILKGPVDLNSQLDLDRRAMTIRGELTNGGFGGRVGIAGDLNHDGMNDLVVSGLDSGTHGGDVHIIFGNAALGSPGTVGTSLGSPGRVVIRQPNPDDLFGWAIAAVGDLTGDGVDDLAIGAPATDFPDLDDVGAVYVVSGASLLDGSTLDLALLDGHNGFVLRGSRAKGQFGRAIALAGDFDDDRLLDLAVGAPMDGTGQVDVFTGSSLRSIRRPSLTVTDFAPADRVTIMGIANADGTGYSVAGVGDVNGDGRRDLLIGASQIARPSVDSGMAFLVFGRPSAGSNDVIQLKSLDGSNGFAMAGFPSLVQGQGDILGHVVSGAGDFNGDGVADFAVAAPRANPGGNDSGAVFLVFGKPGLGAKGRTDLTRLVWPYGLVIQGSENGDSAGSSISVGDINRDGLDDVIVGAPNEDPSMITDAGTAYVIFGRR